MPKVLSSQSFLKKYHFEKQGLSPDCRGNPFMGLPAF
jgi:hypothetical protein